MIITPQNQFLSNEQQQQVHAFKSILDGYVASERADATNTELANMYHTSVWAYTASNYWANKLSSVPFRLHNERGDVIESASPFDNVYPLVALLNSPDFIQFIKQTEISLRFWGASLAKKERNVHGTMRALSWVNPFLFTPQTNGISGLQNFRIYAGRNQQQHSETLMLHDSVYIKEMLNFDDDVLGTSSAEVSFLQASATTEIAMTQLASFQNLAIPASIVQPKQASGAGGFSLAPSEDDVNALQRFINMFVRGARNASKTIITSAGWEWTQLSPPWKDTIPVEQERALRESVASGFDIPIEFITTGQTNFAELQGKIEIWLQDRFMPRAMWYASEFTEQLCKDESYYGFTIKPDFSEIHKSLEKTKLDNIERKKQSGLISLGMAQEEIGLPPEPAFNDLYYYDGVGYVPKSEFPNIWKYKVLPDYAVEQLVYSQPSTPSPTPDAPPSVDSVEQSVINEIDSATRYAIKQSPFEPRHISEHTVSYIRHLIDEGIERDDAKQSAVEHYVSLKARANISPIRAFFERRVDAIFTSAVAGKYTKSGFVSALTPVLMSTIEDASVAGIKDAGVKIKSFDEMEPDEKLFVETWKSQQHAFIQQVADAIYLDNKVSPKEAKGKAQLWWNKSVNPVYVEMIARASANSAFERKLGATEQHCVDCVRIDGQVRRASFWHSIGIWNASPKTQCGGWRCECRNVATNKPISRGRFPTIVGHG